MPEEIFVIIISAMALGAGISVVKTITSYLLSRQKKGDLTSSELSNLISAAVEEAVQPLKDQMTRIERISSASDVRRLSAHEKQSEVRDESEDVRIR